MPPWSVLDNRQAARERFDDRNRRALLIAIGCRDARRQQDVGVAQGLGHPVVFQPAGEAHRHCRDHVAGQRFEFPTQYAVADDRVLDGFVVRTRASARSAPNPLLLHEARGRHDPDRLAVRQLSGDERKPVRVDAERVLRDAVGGAPEFDEQ